MKHLVASIKTISGFVYGLEGEFRLIAFGDDNINKSLEEAGSDLLISVDCQHRYGTAE